MLEISNNSISIFKACQKKYYWHYIRGLTSYRKSPALILGSIIHSAFDMFYNNFTDEEIVKYIKDTCDEEISKASPDEAEALVVMKYTLLGMWVYYPKNLALFTDIKPELEIKLKFMYGVRLVLRMDGLVVKDGNTWVRELKTSGLSYEQFERKSKASSQATLYTYVAKRLGYPVQGVMFDFIKKHQLRKNMREDKDQFGYRIMMSYKSKPDYYFHRHLSYRSEEELDLFEQDLITTTRDLQRRCRDGKWTRNTDSCWKFNAPCPYLNICFQKNPDPLTIKVFYKQEDINPNKGGKCVKEKSNK